MSKAILNLINFVRGCEPRDLSIDLVGTLREELELAKKHGLRSTVLFQYDALVQKEYRDLVAEYAKDGSVEIGMWIELVRTCTLKGGAEWTGRDQEWDWGAAQCNLVGHTPEKRKSILDECMRAFHEYYGKYPAVIGAWSIDTVSLSYLKEKYDIQGACLCKDQVGTDSYTLWGGYYSGGYYPSSDNVFSPAQTLEKQINVPVFRMLGSDPIYQYDCSLDVQNGSACQGVVTLEPVYFGKGTGGGGEPGWVDWFFRENFNPKALGYTYAQAGQENSFGWGLIGRGLTYQVEQIAKLQSEGKLECMTLGETAKWFTDTYRQTPANSLIAETDWKEEGRKTYWYESKNYRVNLHKDAECVWLRDMFLFDENYRERYLTEALTTPYYEFDNLPVIDGFRWTGNGTRCGVYFVGADGKYIYGDTEYQKGESDITVCIEGQQKLKCTFRESLLEFESELPFTLSGQADGTRLNAAFSVENNKISVEYRGHCYALAVKQGTVAIRDGKLEIASVNGKAAIEIVR